MPKWYKLIKDEKHIEDFLFYIQGLHDYSIEKVTYETRRNIIDLFLRYDTRKEGVLLRFFWIRDFKFEVGTMYGADYLYNCAVSILENGNLFWCDNDIGIIPDDDDIYGMEAIRKFGSFVEAEELYWAITDKDGNPIEEQEDRFSENSDDCRRQFVLGRELDLNPYYGDFSELEPVWLNKI